MYDSGPLMVTNGGSNVVWVVQLPDSLQLRALGYSRSCVHNTVRMDAREIWTARLHVRSWIVILMIDPLPVELPWRRVWRVDHGNFFSPSLPDGRQTFCLFGRASRIRVCSSEERMTPWVLFHDECE